MPTLRPAGCRGRTATVLFRSPRSPSGSLGPALQAPGGGPCPALGPFGASSALAVTSGAVSPRGPLDASVVWVLAGLSYLLCGASSSGGPEMFFHCVLRKSVPRAPASGPSCEARLVSGAGGQPGGEIRPEWGCRHGRPRPAQAASGVRRFLQHGRALEKSTPASALKAACTEPGELWRMLGASESCYYLFFFPNAVS